MENIRALLVDDEGEFTSALAERLNLRGIHTTACCSGEEALRAIEADPPGVVLLDLMMPGLGGREIYERIRSTRPHIKVIFLTGRDASELGPDCAHYLIKPVNIDELVGKIRLVCSAGKTVDGI